MILQKIIFIIIPLIIQCEYVANRNHSGLKERVIPPYRTAMTLLNEDILDKLMNIHTIYNQRQLTTLIHELYCTNQQICNNLQQAISTNDELKDEIDIKIVELYSQISKTEIKLQQSQTDLMVVQTKISHFQSLIVLTERAVQDKEEDTKSAQRALNEAEFALLKARHCLRRKRRETWFERAILKPIFHASQAVFQGVCSIVNSGGISNVKHRVEVAQTSLNEVRNSLTNYQNQRTNAINEKMNTQSQLFSVIHQLAKQNQQLEQQRNEQTFTIELSVLFKVLTVHLNTIFESSDSLLKALNMIVGLNTLIKPLDEIYDELLNKHLIDDENLKIPLEKAKETKRKLKWLKQKLPQIFSLNDQFYTISCDSNDSFVFGNEIESNQTIWLPEEDQDTLNNGTFIFQWDDTKDLLTFESDSDETDKNETSSSETDFKIPEPDTFTTDDYQNMILQWDATLKEITTEMNSKTLSDDGRRFFEITKLKLESQIKTVNEHLAKKQQNSSEQFDNSAEVNGEII